MKYGVNTLAWTTRVDERLVPLVSKIKRWGFDGVELFLSPDEPANLTAVNRMLDAEGLERTTCSVLPREANLVSRDAQVRAQGVEFLKKCVDRTAERGGNAILEVNPKLLIMVEGPEYSTDLTAFAKLPVVLKVTNRLVYSPHAYASSEHVFQNYEELRQIYDERAGYLLKAEPAIPLWVGEFGTCQTLDCGQNSQWFRWFVQYLAEKDLSWSYWPLNGTQSSGAGRKYDTVETYGLVTTDYRRIAAPKIVELLRTIKVPAQRDQKPAAH